METKYNDLTTKIVEEINKRAPDLKCPACKKDEFVLGGGYFAHDLQQDLKQRQIGGVNVPTVPIICGNCGYVMEFAVGTLKLLPKKEEVMKEEKKNPSNK